jgi:hypothetical protein
MRSTWLVILLLAVATAHADHVPTPITRLAGINAPSGISYVLLTLEGKLIAAPSQPTPPPRLTAQCTRTPSGKLHFELLTDVGGIPDLAYYPPWRPISPQDLFPPRLDKTPVTMEFLGYTKVKPVKRQWEYLLELPGELRYATPGMASANMEEIMFYLRYMRSLPTLRLTVPGRGTAEWETTRWQAAIHAEPLCAASGL